MKILTLTSALALLTFTLATPARAETTNCTAITALPYTITTQGVYCLTGHLSTGMVSGAAITIDTNNVVLDLNGYKLGGQAAGAGTVALGINAFKRQNITIKNGTVRGFSRGIYLDDVFPYTVSQGHVIEDVRADQNTYSGISVYGIGNVIRNNQVVATGGTTVYGANASAFGIVVGGPGTQVLNNMVTEAAAQGTGEAYGIYLSFATNSVVVGNRITNLTSPSGNSYGILLNGGADLIVSDNRLSALKYGIYFTGGATGSYMNNLVRSTSSTYTGGTAAGATNF